MRRQGDGGRRNLGFGTEGKRVYTHYTHKHARTHARIFFFSLSLSLSFLFRFDTRVHMESKVIRVHGGPIRGSI